MRLHVVYAFDGYALLGAVVTIWLVLVWALENTPPEEVRWRLIPGGFAGQSVCWSNTQRVVCAYEPPEVTP